MLRLITETATVCFQPFVICFWGEMVTKESEDIAISAYNANFIGADVRFQKALAFIIRRSQKPLRLRAGNFIETSLVTFAWVTYQISSNMIYK